MSSNYAAAFKYLRGKYRTQLEGLPLGSVDGSTRKLNWLRLENTCSNETMVLQRCGWLALSHSIRRVPFGFLVLLCSRCGT